jgi:hypothetical protein
VALMAVQAHSVLTVLLTETLLSMEMQQELDNLQDMQVVVEVEQLLHQLLVPTLDQVQAELVVEVVVVLVVIHLPMLLATMALQVRKTQAVAVVDLVIQELVAV